MRRNYNPYLLPPWLRKVRFYCKHIIIPLAIFQAIRTLFVPTTGDFILLLILIFFAYLFTTDFI
ncbi:hypothetical protein [Solibacillus sp. FSL H8-0538]|uniref:hypothetical protein n=1 Tax=Solibacillus sp. FSL H8-0538 TaxID=2921400 RepID=UPI0030F8D9A8